jgi:predicted RNA-binding Zn-ribbon protein involved in translation (DUF1610 family)
LKSRITFPHPETNVGKLRQLDELHAEYVRYVGVCVAKLVADRKVNVFPSERKTYFPTCETLSSQILKNAQNHAVDLITTWVAGLYGRTLRSHIGKQKFSESETVQLYTIGKYKLTRGGLFGRATVGQELIDLYWSWVWNPEISGHTPTVGERTPMHLTQMTCTFGESKKSEFFDGWWLRFSTLTRRHTAEIPLKKSPYLRSSKDLSLSVLARKTPDGGWVFQFTEKAEAPVFVGTAGKVGVDVGLVSLAATSDGTLYGRDFKAKFDRLRKRVGSLRANRQRQGFKQDSHRLWKLERRLSGQIKTATGTVANKLIAKYPEHTFVIEDLDLSGCKGSKRFAYRALQVSLATKAKIEEVNSAYTSQLCPSCGHVAKGNRCGPTFRCQSCGRKGHADFVGGLNLLGRSGDKQIGLKTSPKSVKAILAGRYQTQRSRPPRSPSVGASTVWPVAHSKGMPSGHTCTATNTMDEHV